MATYSTIKGFTIQSLASDPVASTVAAGTWASGTDMNSKHAAGMGAGVSSTACFGCGGYSTPATSDGLYTEVWNGSTWTEVNNLNTARASTSSASGQGTVTAMLAIGGSSPSPTPRTVNCEQYNGTSWTEVGNLALARA